MSNQKYLKEEERISEAIASVANFVSPNLSQLAKRYEVPYERLWSRYHGRQSRLHCGGRNKLLLDPQKIALSRLIDREEQYGSFILYYQVEHRANWLLEQCHHNVLLGENPNVEAVVRSRHARLKSRWCHLFLHSTLSSSFISVYIVIVKDYSFLEIRHFFYVVDD